MSRRFLLSILLAVSLSPAMAKTASERADACATSVSELRDIDPDSVSIEDSDDDDGGSRQIFFRTPDNRGSCLFDSADRLIDVRMATGTEPWNGRGGGDVSAQEQACAGEMSRRSNVAINRVTIAQSRPARQGGRRMIVMVEGASAICVTTQFNAISEFRLLE